MQLHLDPQNSIQLLFFSERPFSLWQILLRQPE
ncbi:hypothetical protein CA51_13140 [Rosistilla oblonga]|nr:hypothetical protein CA51_13140 [Rosistilla oblonga]